MALSSENKLSSDIQIIKGIGPKKAALFNKLDVNTIEDAIYFFPREYEYRSPINKVASIKEGMVALCLKWKGIPQITRKSKGLSIVIRKGYDETGIIECIWFNQPYKAKSYKYGTKYYVYGKAVKRPDGYQIQNPFVEEYNELYHRQPKYLPIYPLTNGLTQRDVRLVTSEALKLLEFENFYYEVDRYITKRYNLISKVNALRFIHYPEDANSIRTARTRIIFDEFLQIQVATQFIKSRIQRNNTGHVISISRETLGLFLKDLPFKLTGAQERVLNEILVDIKSGNVMNRLVQGDVGSGKTVIAAIAMYCVAINGYQSVMMAPTEILAQQHFDYLTKLFNTCNSTNKINVGLLTGSMKESEKRKVKSALRSDRIQILIGTHAVLEENVSFRNLGLVITDEQHRFGVRQRIQLRSKGKAPHMLVMSATPIPRTLTHIIYGDLNLSIIDSMPPGRMPVKTYVVHSGYRKRVYNFVKKHALQGNQAYIVCPLVEKSDNIDMRSAELVFQELTKGILKEVSIGLMHGKMNANEKEEVMQAFAEGKTQVLISTTVIEVGINVPNAVIMVIENAERFGLAQLHQLRGRVGRGDKPSYCILISDIKDDRAFKRLQILSNTNDGFEIAQKDLGLRGPGEIYGLRQHGKPDFRLADPLRDYNLYVIAEQAAKEIVKQAEIEPFKEFICSILEKYEDELFTITAN